METTKSLRTGNVYCVVGGARLLTAPVPTEDGNNPAQQRYLAASNQKLI
jgi:hypothetical protein